MNTINLKKVNQTLGFFSMTIAWALMNLLYTFYLVWKDGKADDNGVVIFWSGLFIIIAWAIFIIWPLHRLDHSGKLFHPLIFPLITGLYAVLAYSIIVGGLFGFDLAVIFLPLALLTGVIFGLSYSLFIRSDKLILVLTQRPYVKIFFFISPVVILFFFLWVLPTIAPSLVFRYMPEEIRNKIVNDTIQKYKVGDDFNQLDHALPGYFEAFENGSGGVTEESGNFGFVLQVNCNKIIRIVYGNPKDVDLTIYGKLQDKPCK
jgi:hypothetical protein